MKAEQWRGEEGERKKTAVYDYIWEEEEVSPNTFHHVYAECTLFRLIERVKLNAGISFKNGFHLESPLPSRKKKKLIN